MAGQPYPLPPSANTCDVLYNNEHHSTYGTQHPLTTNNSFSRTSVQRAPAAITLFPLSTTLSLEQCTSSRSTFPLKRAVGFIYVSTRSTIIGGKIVVRVLPVPPFSPCDAPGISRYPHLEGEPCTCIYNPTFPIPCPGKVFDSNGYYAGYVPASLGATIVHVIFIQAWNKIYRKVATRLTERENHRTEEVSVCFCC